MSSVLDSAVLGVDVGCGCSKLGQGGGCRRAVLQKGGLPGAMPLTTASVLTSRPIHIMGPLSGSRTGLNAVYAGGKVDTVFHVDITDV